tara:strand:- start:372 stop:1280 length:909 start_codon:yes stop_codon:yes gene_type:complete
MENQSIALAKMLNANFKLINYNPPYFLKKFPILGKFYAPYFLRKKLHTDLLPSIIITTGRRMAGTSIALKSILKNNVKTIHIQNPKLSPNNFDLLLIPEHDRIKGKNIIQTNGALCFFEEKDVKKLKEPYLNKIKTKKCTVLLMVGGNSKKQKPNNSEYFELGTKVIHGVKNLDAQLIVSFSRRTPSKAIKILQSTFSKHLKEFKMLSLDENNLYPKILEIIDFTIVTSDSVNMISELATLSKPLFIFHFSKGNRKISFFISNLKELNIVQDYEGNLFKFEKNKLQTNKITTSQVNKFFGFK